MRPLTLSLGGVAAAVRRSYSPARLFAAGEPGVWLDPSDMSTLFQDVAGTIPVTAVEQPVGLIRDKSGRGNNATQAASASRPVLSARINRLINTDHLDAATWVRTNLATPVDMGAGVWTIVPDATLGVHQLQQSGPTIGAAVFEVDVKAAGIDWVLIGELAQTGKFVRVSLGTGVADISASAAVITPQGDGWYRVSLKVFDDTTHQGTGNYVIQPLLDGTQTAASTYAGDGVAGVLVRRPQVVRDYRPRATFSASGYKPGRYQRVTTATDYDLSGWPLFLRLNESTWMQTSNIQFSTAVPVTVWQSLAHTRKTQWVDVYRASDGGGFWAAAQKTGAIGATGAVGSPLYRVNGVSVANLRTALYAAQIDRPAVLSASPLTLPQDAYRVGGYSTYETVVEFYGLIMRAAAATAADDIVAAEQWLNRKTGAF